VLAAGLVMVKVSVVGPPTGTGPPNALLIVGGATTVRLAVLLAAPDPLCVEETAAVVFERTPAAFPVTFTLRVQVLPGVAMVPPVSETAPEPAVAVGVPAQVLLILGVEATTRPVGKLSVNARPVRAATLPAGFVIVKVNDVFVFSGMLGAPNALLIVGGKAALKVAVLLTRPVPPFVEFTAPVVLGKTPATVGVTFTLSVQVAFAPVAAMAPLTSEMLPALAVGVPAQVFVRLGVAATTKPVGSVSPNATPVRPTVLAAGLVIVKVRVVAPPTAMPLAPKALLIVGGATTTRTKLLLARPAPLCVDEIGRVWMLRVPAAVPVTLTTNAQVAFAARVTPDKPTEEGPPVTPAVVPPQAFDTRGVEPKTKPAGRLSVNCTPVRVTVLTEGLAIKKVSVVDPFSGISDVPSIMLIVGGAAAFRVAVLLAVPVPPLVELTAPVVSGKLPA